MAYWKNGQVILPFRKYRYSKDGESSVTIKEFYAEDGTLKSREDLTVTLPDKSFKEKINDWFKTLEYTYRSLPESFIKDKILEPCVGKSLDELDVFAKQILAESKQKRDIRSVRRSAWDEYDDEFKNFVLSFDKRIDMVGRKFNVSVFLSTKNAFPEKREFVKRRVNDICKWVKEELASYPMTRQALENVEEYKALGMCFCSENELEVHFVVTKFKEKAA